MKRERKIDDDPFSDRGRNVRGKLSKDELCWLTRKNIAGERDFLVKIIFITPSISKEPNAVVKLVPREIVATFTFTFHPDGTPDPR